MQCRMHAFLDSQSVTRLNVLSHQSLFLSSTQNSPTCVVHCLKQFGDQDLVLRVLLLQQTQLLPHVLQVETVIKIQVLLQYSLSPVWWQLWSKSLC